MQDWTLARYESKPPLRLRIPRSDTTNLLSKLRLLVLLMRMLIGVRLPAARRRLSNHIFIISRQLHYIKIYCLI